MTADDDPQALRARLRAGLVAAMKARRPEAVSALRTTLAAFDDAEAVAPPAGSQVVATSEHIAGAAAGLGATEAERRTLTIDDLHAILRAQIAERTAEAQTYDGLGRPDAVARLRAEADELRNYLPG